VRNVVVLGDSASPRCGAGHRRIELSPRAWTSDTIAANYAVHVPNPRASGQREDTAIPGSAVLQTDRRTIVVDYTFGGCSELTSAAAKQEGPRVTVRAVTGVAKQTDDTACPMSREYGTALIRLPREAPAGATITVARG
jgi:hypothetical protein